MRYTNKYNDVKGFFCEDCQPEAKRFREKYNKRISRNKGVRRFVSENGGVGRVKQMIEWNKEAREQVIILNSMLNRIGKIIEWNEEANRRIVNLREQVRYYKGK